MKLSDERWKRLVPGKQRAWMELMLIPRVPAVHKRQHGLEQKCDLERDIIFHDQEEVRALSGSWKGTE